MNASSNIMKVNIKYISNNKQTFIVNGKLNNITNHNSILKYLSCNNYQYNQQNYNGFKEYQTILEISTITDDININHVNGEPNITYTHGNLVYDDANNIKTKILKIAHNGKLYNNITNAILGIQEYNNVIVSIKAPTYRTWEDMINDEFCIN